MSASSRTSLSENGFLCFFLNHKCAAGTPSVHRQSGAAALIHVRRQFSLPLLLHQQNKWKRSCSRVNRQSQKSYSILPYLSARVFAAEHSHKENILWSLVGAGTSWATSINVLIYKVKVKSCKQDINSVFKFAAKSLIWQVAVTHEVALPWILLTFHPVGIQECQLFMTLLSLSYWMHFSSQSNVITYPVRGFTDFFISKLKS